ncbi:integrin alpha-9-like [Amphiura filiformis]|uniref:integrin alpha-9-like n=1 Tax=Amphiura filiformis TaxID=82378 RepID=UPI003B2167ED
MSFSSLIGLRMSPVSSCAIFSIVMLFSCNVFGCNIDTTNPTIYSPPTVDEGLRMDYTGGLFGYSVLLHKAFVEKLVLVGAPTANSFYLNVERPGVLFLCSSLFGSCEEINLDDSGNTEPVGPEYQHMKDNAWIGVSLTEQPPKPNDELSDVMVCGHRYANDYFVQFSNTPDDNTNFVVNETITPDDVNSTFDANDRFPNGICYTFGHDMWGYIVKEELDGVKTMIPCAEYNQMDESTRTRVHGWCQAGMSAQYTSDGNGILLGAAGSYNWAGTVFEGDRVDLDFKPAPDIWGEDNDYTGYAVASGNFRSTDSIQGVASAPRAMRRQKDITTGKVIIYDLETYEVYQELYGDLMNTYYGAAIAAIDLNNDNCTDLLVGAPLYTVEQDEGRVYVYINNCKGQVEPQDFKLSGNDAFGARFGSAIAGAGDLNDDGFEDVVIGAPWEDDNSGAVYVYFGSASGIQMKYSQRLGGRDFMPDVQSFGLSVGGGIDADSNFQPDIVVGAPFSETVFLFKTRPVANLRVWLVMNPDPMDPDIQSCELDGKPITCVEVSVCFFYESESTPTSSINMDIELTADYFRVEDGFKARFYFLEDTVRVSSFYRSEVQARYGKEVCYPYKAYLEETAVDFLTPLFFYLYYGLTDYSNERVGGDRAPRFFSGLPPIIDENICGNGSFVDELRFIQDCGADAICQTDLQLSGNIIFPSGELDYPLGAYLTMLTEIQVDNVGEEAHNAKLLIRHSKEIVFEALEQSQSSCLSLDEAQCSMDVVVTCQPVESQNNTAAVECDLGNPMRSNTSSVLHLRFDVGAVTYEYSSGFLDFTAEVSTISTEVILSNNVYQPHIPVVVLADTAVRGQSDPPSVLYETNKTALDSADKLNLDTIGPPFSLLFEATNVDMVDLGRLPFDSVVYVSIPWRLSNGDWLIYIKNIKTRGVPGTCNSKEVLDLQILRLEEHYVSKTSDPKAPTNVERVYEGIPEVDPTMEDKQLPMPVTLLFMKPSAFAIVYRLVVSQCVTIQCDINGPLHKGDSFVVVVEALLWAATFSQSELHLQFQEIVSQAVIEVNDPDGVYEQPQGHQPDYYNLATGVVTDKPPSQPVAWWIILLSILGGILLLFMLVVLLYKCGFFKREKKAEMKAKKMSMQTAGQANGDDNEAYVPNGGENHVVLQKEDGEKNDEYDNLKKPEDGEESNEKDEIAKTPEDETDEKDSSQKSDDEKETIQENGKADMGDGMV